MTKILSSRNVLLCLLIIFTLIFSPAIPASADHIEAGHHPPSNEENPESSSPTDNVDLPDPIQTETQDFSNSITDAGSTSTNTSPEEETSQDRLSGGGEEFGGAPSVTGLENGTGQDPDLLNDTDILDNQPQPHNPESPINEDIQPKAMAAFSADLQQPALTLSDSPSDVFADMQKDGDYWLIETFSHLNAVREALSDKYRLANDINLSEVIWTPIGNSNSSSFRGTFDGDGFTISGINISGKANYSGLFGYTNGATIQNLNLEIESITGGNYTGGLIGYADNESIIVNCNITAANREDSQGTISGGNYVGGIAGYLKNSKVINSSSNAYVKGNNAVGGIAGYLSNGSLIKKSYADVRVEGQLYVGGLAGSSTLESVIINSYSAGEILGDDQVGGLIGRIFNATSITNSYSICKIYALSYDYGALVGYTAGSSASPIFNCIYWNNSIVPLNPSEIGFGLTDEQMFLESSFKNQEGAEGFDFEKIWYMDESLGYPVLQWQISTQPSDPDDSEEPNDPGDGDRNGDLPGNNGGMLPTHPLLFTRDVAFLSVQAGTFNNNVYFQLLSQLNLLDNMVTALNSVLPEPPAAAIEEITLLLAEILELFNANRHLLSSAQQEYIISRLELLLSAFRI